MVKLQALAVLAVATCFCWKTSRAYSLAAPKLKHHHYSSSQRLGQRVSPARRSAPGILMASHLTYCGGCVIRRADPSEALAAAELAGVASKGDGVGEVYAAVLEEGGTVVAGGGYAASGEGIGEITFLASDQERLEGKNGDEAEEVMRMILLVIERAARSSRSGISKLRANVASEMMPTPGLLLNQGYAETAPSRFMKDLDVGSGDTEAMRRGSGDKGAGELLDVIDEDCNVLCVRSRREVETHNLLHRAVGVLVHDREGRIYVHKRSPNKSSNPSCYDMLVGGLVLSGESSIDAARGEVGEELGLVGAAPQLLFTTRFMSRKIRCFVDMYRVEFGEGDAIRHDDGEVVWGKFMSLEELHAMMEKEKFVPGGLACWGALCEQGFDRAFLK